MILGRILLVTIMPPPATAPRLPPSFTNATGHRLSSTMAKPQPSWGLAGPDVPPSPRTMRTLRKIQSHQVLSSSGAVNTTTATTQPSQPPAFALNSGLSSASAATRARAQRRPRSNSDAAARETAATSPVSTQRRPARKTGSGVGLKRSLLESLLRDGPQNGKTAESLQELKYLVLSSRVDADGDGMVVDISCPEITMDVLTPGLFPVTIPDIRLACPVRDPSSLHRRVPRPHPPGRLPSLYKDPQRHIPHIGHGPTVQTPSHGSKSNSATQCRSVETARQQAQAPIAAFFVSQARNGDVGQYAAEYCRRAGNRRGVFGQ